MVGMAIEKNNFKVSRVDSEFSHGSRETMSSDEEELLQQRVSAVVESDEEDDDDDFDDADSGAGSDDFDLLEFGESGAEYCQVGNVTCSIPFELFDLQGLEDILSVEVWNECLTEEERFSLTKYLPDMDQHTFMCTLKELLEGGNFHFGTPIKKLFDLLKGGDCEPRVALYREGRNLFQRRRHYHRVRKYHNDMVLNFCQIRDAWTNCRGYSIDEKLRVLNIQKSQKHLMHEKMGDFEADSSGREESFDGLWSRRVKDKKSERKLDRHSVYGVESSLELPSRRQLMALEQAKHGKQNPKSVPKMGSSKFPLSKESMGRFPSVYNGLDANSGQYSSSGPLYRQKYDHIKIDDDDVDAEDPLFGMRPRRNRDVFPGGIMEKPGFSRVAKKHDYLRDKEPAPDRFIGLPYASELSVVKSSYDLGKKGKYPENVQLGAIRGQMKGRSFQLPVKGSLADLSDRAEPYRRGKIQEDAFSMDPSFIADDHNGRRKKWKTAMESPDDFSIKSYRASPQQMNERLSSVDFRENLLQEKIRVNVAQNGGPDMAALRGSRGAFMRNDDTESDSSEPYDDNDSNPLMLSKLAFSGRDAKKSKFGKKGMLEDDWVLDGRSRYSKNMGKLGEDMYMPAGENYLSKSKQKGKMCDSSPLNNFASRDFEDSSVLGLGKFKEEDERKQKLRPGKSSQFQGQVDDRFLRSSPIFDERKRKVFDEDDDSREIRFMADDKNNRGRLGKKGHIFEAHGNNGGEKSETGLLGCSMVTKKKKAKEFLMDMERRDENSNMQFDLQQPIDDSTSSKKKGKKKLEADTGSPNLGTLESPKAEPMEVEIETKPQKKPFTPITPTVHTGFSFSIIHLLTALRMAMISPRPEDALENGEHKDGENWVPVSEDGNTIKSNQPGEGNLPSLTVQEIVNCVRSNPGDPCILETQEPLQDLIRGVLKIFSSKSAPLGAKGWKALVSYEKSSKSWSWIGPVPPNSTDHETFEEVTSPEAWGLPHKMLVKLVDSFANWLKNGQETLQQIGSLPAPPLSLMQCNLDEKERFKDLRAQKSLNTITPSSDEVRAYFRKEEVLRYSIPDRAFAYTAADGRKSIVAPLRRGGGKPTSKARDHFMLKRDRPPHVTILCLVRDAAARLPGSIGTRADVCTLIRDSQYIVEDVTDAQVNQVVSGALDRLHYERDPCVQFDAERKLWVYLHRDREEEDFEDDGTSSTKKWKRPKKDAAEQSDQGAVTVAFHGNGEQSGFDLGSDLNTDPSVIEEEKGTDPMCDDVRQNAEDNVDDNNIHEDQTMVWDAVGSNPLQENRLLCQENSTNEDFDDET